jgi:hypothetical protein
VFFFPLFITYVCHNLKKQFNYKDRACMNAHTCRGVMINQCCNFVFGLVEGTNNQPTYFHIT